MKRVKWRPFLYQKLLSSQIQTYLFLEKLPALVLFIISRIQYTLKMQRKRVVIFVVVRNKLCFHGIILCSRRFYWKWSHKDSRIFVPLHWYSSVCTWNFLKSIQGISMLQQGMKRLNLLANFFYFWLFLDFNDLKD